MTDGITVDEVNGLTHDLRAEDPALADVADVLYDADPEGHRTGTVLRNTFDQLYDGQRTGRYSWEQLFKTEKTHFGTLFEINLRREFDDVIYDGQLLDFEIAGQQVDCKYSQTDGGWMLPPECRGEILLVATASDKGSEWSLGLVRARPELLRTSQNRDAKTGLNAEGRTRIAWLHRRAALPPNVLLSLPGAAIDSIFGKRSGQQRVNELIRQAEGRMIGRSTIATVAQQDDFMKRVRADGGARTLLAPEGFLVIGGDYTVHRDIATGLGVEPPAPGHILGIRVVEAAASDSWTVSLDGRLWRRARPDEPVTLAAPLLPTTRRRSGSAQ